MGDESHWLQISRSIKEAKTDNFMELHKLSGFDKTKDYRYADWSGIDFTNCDLRGFDFSGARLRDCNFKNALIEGARYDQAEINGTNLRAAKDWRQHVQSWTRNPTEVSTDHLPHLSSFHDFPFGPEMVVIPSGTFMMGSKEGKGYQDGREYPQHEVTITEPFAVGKYPVTIEEYDHYCDKTGQKKPDDQGWGRDRRPVINVRWYQAQEYIKWLNGSLGDDDSPYRLLSEAQWEYACRAGSDTEYCFGDDASQLSEYGWHILNSDGKTHPIGEKKPNDFGLYDMHGNVWELVEDHYHDSYKHAPEDGSAWLDDNAKKDALHVLRGGSWDHFPQILRSADRSRDYAVNRFDYIGFRVTRTLR